MKKILIPILLLLAGCGTEVCSYQQKSDFDQVGPIAISNADEGCKLIGKQERNADTLDQAAIVPPGTDDGEVRRLR